MTFLVGEYTDREIHDNPAFTVADSILWLRQDVERSSIVRRYALRTGERHRPAGRRLG